MRRVLARLARLARLRDPGLLVCACVCAVVAAAMVFPPAGWAAAAVSFVVMDVATDPDDGKP